MVGKREFERALIKVGCSHRMAKRIISSGFPGYRASLTPEELEEIGLAPKAFDETDPVASLIERATILLKQTPCPPSARYGGDGESDQGGDSGSLTATVSDQDDAKSSGSSDGCGENGSPYRDGELAGCDIAVKK